MEFKETTLGKSLLRLDDQFEALFSALIEKRNIDFSSLPMDVATGLADRLARRASDLMLLHRLDRINKKLDSINESLVCICNNI